MKAAYLSRPRGTEVGTMKLADLVCCYCFGDQSGKKAADIENHFGPTDPQGDKHRSRAKQAHEHKETPWGSPAKDPTLKIFVWGSFPGK